MQIAENTDMLEIKVDMMGKASAIYPVLVRDKGSVILIDTGFPGTLPLLRKEIEKIIAFRRLNTVILTHQDIDHIGNLSAIIKEIPGKIKVLCHEAEKPYIQGDKEPHKLGIFKTRMQTMPPEQKAIYEKMIAGFKTSFANVDQTLTDNEELPLCGGGKVIYTPGHTVGHICLYFLQSKLLVAGDALNVDNGSLVRPPSANQYNPNQFEESIKKLAGLDIDKVICFHGGLAQSNVNQRIRALASGKA